MMCIDTASSTSLYSPALNATTARARINKLLNFLICHGEQFKLCAVKCTESNRRAGNAETALVGGVVLARGIPALAVPEFALLLIGHDQGIAQKTKEEA